MFDIYYEMICQLLLMGAFAISLLVLLYYIAYYVIYKGKMKGKKIITEKKALIFIVFVTYIYMVIGITLVIREPVYGGINLKLFSTYNKFFATNSSFWFWQILFNIIMMMPFGFLLPLVCKIFRKFYYTLPVALFFSILLEFIQLKTMRGSFDMDDIFNNFLGSFLGYCIVIIFLKIIEKIKRESCNIKH